MMEVASGQGVILGGKGEAPLPGALITGPLEIFPPQSASLPGAFDYRLYLAGRGLSWRGRISECKTIPMKDPVARLGQGIFHPLREGLVTRINQYLPKAEAGMACAVLLGIRNDESRRASRPFSDLGLAHLFAVSGLHVGILLGIIMLPAQVGGFSPWLRVGPLLVLLPVYVLLTGMPGSVVRAASLGFFALLAVALGRPAQPLRLIGLLFWAGSIWDPVQNLDTGLKLSYLAAGGILSVSALTNGLKFTTHRLLGPVYTGLAVSGAAQWFTLPLVAGSFGRISMLSPLANLLAVPLFGLAVWCVVLSLVLGEVWGQGAEIVASLAWLLFRSMAGLAGFISRTSGGFPIGLPSPGVGRLVIWVLLSVFAILLLKFHREDKLPGRRVLLLILAIMATGLSVFGPLAWNLKSPDKVTAWQFDVGQGDCGLLVFPDGWSLLIDTGGRYGFGGSGQDGPLFRTVLPFVQRNGRDGIDAVVLTHGHLDHTGGAAALAGALHVEHWYVSGRAARSLRGVVDTTSISHPKAGLVLHRWKEWEVLIVYPPGPLPKDLDENDHSLVIVLRREGKDVAVWSGDLELEGEHLMLASGRAPRNVQVWKAGHHGSNTSGSRTLLDRFDPSLILVSCGVGNGYGHPNHGPYVIDGDTVIIARTDLQGAIKLEWDSGGNLNWRTMENGPLKIGLP
ncbi:MAG: DNA internalization-related competence protein ComEC/Rec2 [Candidatus Krumholzibacteria bacterium]|nr:DNA internalization-related competence protein ComEC/Rec2 [Candidatus Krumholzibacteria bacterium]